jgi:hypothetical protein
MDTGVILTPLPAGNSPAFLAPIGMPLLLLLPRVSELLDLEPRLQHVQFPPLGTLQQDQ